MCIYVHFMSTVTFTQYTSYISYICTSGYMTVMKYTATLQTQPTITPSPFLFRGGQLDSWCFNFFCGRSQLNITVSRMCFCVARNALRISNSTNVTRKRAFPLKNYCIVGYTNVRCVAKHMYTVVISTCSCGTVLRCCPRKS